MKTPDEYNFKVIAKIKSDFPDKFGIPRQSGLVKELRSAIRFEPEFRIAEALRGLEGFSHLWILWIFSENVRIDENGNNRWSPTVRPPRLGGNKRMGVFATRSSFRPNPIAMSCVKIESIRNITDGSYVGPEIIVSGADLMDGTPIVDVKPYLPFTDSIKDARGGFAADVYEKSLDVDFPEDFLNDIRTQGDLSEDQIQSLIEILASDPRPGYKKDPNKVYAFLFADHEIKFKVVEDTLTVLDIYRKKVR